MIPIKLKLSNFTSYGPNPPELDFTSFKLAAISGLNGAGKSSLLDAITWCLWGVARAGDSSDTLIHSGADQMQVEFSFELNGHIYTVKRRRSKKGGGSTALEFWSGTTDSTLHNLTEGTIKNTQQKIIQELHLTFETFTNSSYIRQGHADEFTLMGPTDRKRILSEILGLDHYEKLEERARDRVKIAQTKLQLLDFQLLEIEAELTQKEDHQQKLQKAQDEISQTEKDINHTEAILKTLRSEKEKLTIISEQRLQLEQNLRTSKQELDEIAQQGKNRAERMTKLKQQLEDFPMIEKQLANLSNLRKKKEQLDAQLQKKLKIEMQLAESTGELRLKKQQLAQITSEIENINQQLLTVEKEGSRCPTCGQEIDKIQKNQLKKEILTKKSKLEKDFNSIDMTKEELAIKNLNEILQAIVITKDQTSISSELEKLEKLQTRKEQLVGLRSELETEEKTVVELRNFYRNKSALVLSLEKEVKELPDKTTQLVEINQSISQKEQELTHLREEEKRLRDLFGQVKELMSRSEQLEKQKLQKAEDKKNLLTEKQVYEELALAFGKKGIQAMIIEAAIPEIEREANQLLNKLTEGRMQIAIQSQRETKTKLESGEKGIIETLDIIISDEMGERSYEAYSGGEQFRVNFAIRLAISKLLTNRAGARLQFLVIDEGFGSQDAPGRARLIEAIDTIKDDFEKILVITHIEELKDEFPVRFEVSKNSQGSTFEIVGV